MTAREVVIAIRARNGAFKLTEAEAARMIELYAGIEHARQDIARLPQSDTYDASLELVSREMGARQ